MQLSIIHAHMPDRPFTSSRKKSATYHLRKTVHGGQEDVDLDHLLNATACLLQHGCQVLDA